MVVAVAGLAVVRRDGPAAEPGPFSQVGTPKAGWEGLDDVRLSPRRYPHLAWTGSELLAFGGTWSESDGTKLVRQDGGAYDPSSGRWRPISLAPKALEYASVVWTGRELVVLGVPCTETTRDSGYRNVGCRPGGRSVLAYDPGNDSWRELDGPGDVLDVQSIPGALGWTGAEVVAGAVDRYAALDPGSDRWRALAPVPFEPSVVCLAGKTLVAVDLVDEDPDRASGEEAAVLDLEIGRGGRSEGGPEGWERVPATPATGTPSTGACAGDDVLVVAAAWDVEPARRFDSRTRRWSTLPPVPFSAVDAAFGVGVGDRFVVSSGGNLFAYDPGTGRATSQPTSVSPRQLTWVGDRIVLDEGPTDDGRLRLTDVDAGPVP